MDCIVHGFSKSWAQLSNFHFTHLFNLYVHHTKSWAGEAQIGITITRRNINNLRYADDTTLMQKVRRTRAIDEGERGK